MPVSDLEISKGGRWLELAVVQCAWKEASAILPARGLHAQDAVEGAQCVPRATEGSEPQNGPVTCWGQGAGHPIQKSVWGHRMPLGQRACPRKSTFTDPAESTVVSIRQKPTELQWELGHCTASPLPLPCPRRHARRARLSGEGTVSSPSERDSRCPLPASPTSHPPEPGLSSSLAGRWGAWVRKEL